jgi:hypothetical protein
MPQEANLNHWVSSSHSTAAERAVTHGFWKEFATFMQAYAQAYNWEHRNEGTTHFAFEQNGHNLNVNYGEYLLRILFDERTGKLLYQFVTPKLAIFNRELHGVTEEGELVLDIQSSSFKMASSPSINLDSTLENGETRALNDRLVQYLLQKLISPTFDDEHFTIAELKN